MLRKILKALFKTVIFYIHLVSRTPLILLLYVTAFFGLFGGATTFSKSCFFIFMLTALLALIMVIIFNSKATKEKAENFVGKEFCMKYLSHSTPVTKSFTRIVLPTGYAYILELFTANSKENSFRQSVRTVQDDVNFWLVTGDKAEARRSQQYLNEMIKNYRYCGVISQAFDTLKKAETTQIGITSLFDFGKAFFERGKEK